MKFQTSTISAVGLVIGVMSVSVAGPALSQTLAADVVAAPDVYKVATENARFRMVEGTWKPGQRDAFHSHPEIMFYWLTPCSLRFHMPDGTVRDANVVAGQAGTQPPIASHSVENTSKAQCKVLMLEPK